MPIRLVLADDHYLVREGILRLLEARPDLDVVAVCDDLSSLLAAVEAERPDAIGLSVTMLGALPRTLALARQLRERYPALMIALGGRALRGAHGLAAEAAIEIDADGDLSGFRTWAQRRAS